MTFDPKSYCQNQYCRQMASQIGQTMEQSEDPILPDLGISTTLNIEMFDILPENCQKRTSKFQIGFKLIQQILVDLKDPDGECEAQV